jgi:hypothetical protein
MSLDHPSSRDGERCAFGVQEFCDAHRISRSWLYAEWQAGRGPAFKNIGTKRIITVEAAAAWRNSNSDQVAA